MVFGDNNGQSHKTHVLGTHYNHTSLYVEIDVALNHHSHNLNAGQVESDFMHQNDGQYVK